MFVIGAFLVQTAVAPAPRPLGPPDASLAHEFVRVYSLWERPDGRIVVVDRGDELLAIADFARGTVTRIGRVGGGPEEYRFPGRLVPMGGDSLIVADDGNNRLAVLGPDLRIHRVTSGNAPGRPTELTPRAVDSKGRFYAVIPGWALSTRGEEPDSLPLVRFVPGAKPVETVARLKGSPRPPPPPRRDRPTYPVLVFAPGDAWAATPAGRVAIVRAADYRVEWIEPDGRRTTGPSVAWKPIAVVDRDRYDFTRGTLATTGTSGKGGVDRPPGGLSAVSADMLTDKAIGELVANTRFAKTKGAFTDAAPIIAPDGSLWVERSTPAGASSTWVVFDGRGRPSASWQLPAGRRLAGIGRGRVYLVATDPDGIERLERVSVLRRDPAHEGPADEPKPVAEGEPAQVGADDALGEVGRLGVVDGDVDHDRAAGRRDPAGVLDHLVDVRIPLEAHPLNPDRLSQAGHVILGQDARRLPTECRSLELRDLG